jgi:hypothetical protein
MKNSIYKYLHNETLENFTKEHSTEVSFVYGEDSVESVLKV